MTALDDVFRAYRDATGCEMAVWLASDREASVRVEAATPGAMAPPPRAQLPEDRSGEIASLRGRAIVAPLPGPRPAWLALGPCPTDFPLEEHLAFILPICSQYLQSALEVEHAANELAERYEEINLLYTISEILGRTVALEETAGQILTEISDTVGARRAVILLHERATDTLHAIAAIGTDVKDIPIIDVSDDRTVSSRVFRQLHPMLAEAGDVENEAERVFRRGAMLSVPIVWTSPRSGSEPLGVVHLSDRKSGQPFSAGDQKLIAAIASQIGTAIQNAQLVRANVDRQRLAREMQLAHDLQMRLLPSPSALVPVARVAARVVPAESVGGDFYNLFRLGDARAGVMVGDVSGHGYPAALIMALTMSASAIHAQRTPDPGDTMQALLESLQDELETTEMFMSLLYAVVDREERTLRYANAGHPHAFVVRGSGDIERLPATDPPLGMVPTAPSTQHTEFDPDVDVLLLFTDGVSDARDLDDERLGEGPVLEAVLAHRHETAQQILERVFDVVEGHSQEAPRRDDLTAVVLRG